MLQSSCLREGKGKQGEGDGQPDAVVLEAAEVAAVGCAGVPVEDHGLPVVAPVVLVGPVLVGVLVDVGDAAQVGVLAHAIRAHRERLVVLLPEAVLQGRLQPIDFTAKATLQPNVRLI